LTYATNAILCTSDDAIEAPAVSIPASCHRSPWRGSFDTGSNQPGSTFASFANLMACWKDSTIAWPIRRHPGPGHRRRHSERGAALDVEHADRSVARRRGLQRIGGVRPSSPLLHEAAVKVNNINPCHQRSDVQTGGLDFRLVPTWLVDRCRRSG